MHYYQHRIGDHAAKASNLPLMEEGVLRRLYDVYFETEKPLPDDPAWLCRRVGARTKAEREALRRLLSEFFLLDGQVWRHARFDEQIADFQSGEPERQARKENDKERKRREREDRVRLFTELRGRGVVLPGSTKTGELRRMLDAVTRDGRDIVTADTAIHKPRTSNQQPETTNNEETGKNTSNGAVLSPEVQGANNSLGIASDVNTPAPPRSIGKVGADSSSAPTLLNSPDDSPSAQSLPDGVPALSVADMHRLRRRAENDPDLLGQFPFYMQTEIVLDRFKLQDGAFVLTPEERADPFTERVATVVQAMKQIAELEGEEWPTDPAPSDVPPQRQVARAEPLTL